MSARFKEALLQLNNNKQQRRRQQHCKVDTHSQSQVGVNLSGSSICGSKDGHATAQLTRRVFGRTTQTEEQNKKQKPTDSGKREQEATGWRPPLPSHRHGNTNQKQRAASCGKDNTGNSTRAGMQSGRGGRGGGG